MRYLLNESMFTLVRQLSLHGLIILSIEIFDAITSTLIIQSTHLHVFMSMMVKPSLIFKFAGYDENDMLYSTFLLVTLMLLLFLIIFIVESRCTRDSTSQ